MNRLNLRAQIVGHGTSVLFVFRVNFVAKGRTLGIKHTHRKVCGNVFPKALHHVDHASDGTGGRTARVARYGPQIRHGMKGSVEVTGTIHQQKGFLIAHTPIVPVLKRVCRVKVCQIWRQHPLQSLHAFRHAFGHLFHPFEPPLSHGSFYARYRRASSPADVPIRLR